jgi:hypothetical protein
MKRIRLTQRKYALVDNADYKDVKKYKWFFHRARNHSGYAARRRRKSDGGRGGSISMHHHIMGPGKWDHANLNKLDNRRSNLRRATDKQNLRNRKKFLRLGHCSSRFKGVCWHIKSKRWAAKIVVNKKQINLGCFVDEETAARAYDVAAIRWHKEFACTNFPKSDYGVKKKRRAA